MERFKSCEKEAKTKAFSKAGLAAAANGDPKERAKNATKEWVDQAISDVEQQKDTIESEIETLGGKKGKSDREMQLNTLHALHCSFVTKLELILRLLDNDALPPEDVDAIKGDSASPTPHPPPPLTPCCRGRGVLRDERDGARRAGLQVRRRP